MSLSSLYLDAFVQVAQDRNFSVAAKHLHITQSALSQRILNLEADVGTALFIREPSGLLLTEAGKKLLRYCQVKDSMEQEFWEEINPKKVLGGVLRVAGFSSISRSVLLPMLSSFIKRNPAVQLNLISRELRQLPPTLVNGEAELIFMTEPLEKQGVECHLLGHEINVLIQSSAKGSIQDVYLDHDEDDSTTYDFLTLQGETSPRFRRSYLDDIETIVEGVRLGIGRAVVPLHLLKGVRGIEVVKSKKPLKVPVYLIHYSQSYYTNLQKSILEEVQREFPRYIKA